MKLIKSHHKLGNHYPEIIHFFERKIQELELQNIDLENLKNIDIYIMNGILFDDNGMVYGQLFDGDESKTNLVLFKNNKRNPFRVPYNRLMILLSNYGDKAFIQATIVHEISHLIKNSVDGTTPDLSADGRDEQIARDFEAQYLEQSTYSPLDLKRYMYQKYNPQE